MEGEGKRVHLRSGKGKKANLNPGQIEEYDFFVTQDGGENRETSEADRKVRAKKKCNRNRNTLFFSPD
jgi:hypothetical protein